MLLYLKIKPNQRFDKVEKIGNDWQIRVHAPAIDGKANEKLIEFLSQVLGLSKSRIRIHKGHTNRQKCVEIDAGEDFVNLRMEEAAAGLHNNM